LLLHPRVELVATYAGDFIGQPLSNALPNLEGRTRLVVQAIPSDLGTLPDFDFIFLALPHEKSFDIVGRLRSSPTRIIDCSGAFRVNEAAQYEKFYGLVHPLPELLPSFVYGLSEWNREAIQRSRYVASPGCFATTIELGLLPLARAGLLHGNIHTVGMTGSSGAGSVALPTTHHPVRSQTLRPYKPLEHQHVPEIVETLTLAGGRDLAVHFVPVAAPLVRGILATSFAEVDANIDQTRLDALVDETFAHTVFIRRPASRLPEVVAVSGGNFAEVKIVAGPVRGSKRTVTCLSALDNLVKGGAGQAVQNMNLMFGFDETLGLLDPGSYP
jgi:LysW-gamma-L-alpha-aminoadipyl-6-phosphate/LysW-L-glutamyl-5-phosphate reductase